MGKPMYDIREEEADWIYEKWLDGHTIVDIADHLGVRGQTIMNWLSKYDKATKIMPPLVTPKHLFLPAKPQKEGKK